MTIEAIIEELKRNGDPDAIESAAKFGVTAKDIFLVPTPKLREMAKRIGKNHPLAVELWKTGNYDARALACFIENPKEVTEEQIDTWVEDLDSWAVCDAACNYVFRKTPFAHKKVLAWSKREEEFVKRAAFSLIATMAVHKKEEPDATFTGYLPLIEEAADDKRNFVKKAVNWALRQIGKKNLNLHAQAMKTAEKLAKRDSAAACWIAKDALRELKSEAVIDRLQKKAAK